MFNFIIKDEHFYINCQYLPISYIVWSLYNCFMHSYGSFVYKDGIFEDENMYWKQTNS